MNLKILFLALVLATVLGLGYVHQRVALIASGYDVESLRRTKNDLVDQNQVLAYNVLTLCSPAILNERLAQKNILMTAPRAVQVLAPHMPSVMVGTGGARRTQVDPSWLRQTMKLAVRWIEGSRPAVAEPIAEE